MKENSSVLSKYMNMRIRICLLLLLIANIASAQTFSNKEVGKKNAALIDSLKTAEYPYVLPIWGDKATKAGFQLPYSAGFSVQYIWQKQDLAIDNLNIGFNNGQMQNLDEVVRFDNSTSEASGVNFRPDIWVLPFLNLYGIFAKSKPTTTVEFGVWIPDSAANWRQVYSAKTKAEFDAFSVGFGITPTIGVGGGWIAMDMNFTWTDISALKDPAFSFIFDPRFGKTFKLKKKDSNIAIWVGGFRWNIKSETEGSLPVSDLFNTSDLGTKVDQGIEKVADAQQQVDAWWSGLSTIEQNNPVNKAKYETANRALGAAGTFLSAADAATDNIANSSIQYTLDKQPVEKWNFTVGSQYQVNRHWMLRGEYGFLGTRQQFFVGLQYRFGL